MKHVNPEHLSTIESFVRDVGSLPNEEAKRQRFVIMVGEMFPGSKAILSIPAGAEKVVRLNDRRLRRIDAYHGNAVIEFEKNLDVSLKTAEGQLREQVAGLWNGGESPERPLAAIATDCLTWRTYRPRLIGQKTKGFAAEDVELEPFQAFSLARDSLHAFWLWLTSLLFRDQSIRPDAERLCADFGSTSMAYVEGMRSLRSCWQALAEEGEAQVAFETWRKYLNITYGQLADTGSETPSEETVVLFLKHTYLSVLARFLVWASLSEGRAPSGFDQAVKGCLDGSYFRERNLGNLVESDFFHWVSLPESVGRLSTVWERILHIILTYDWKYLREDVFKSLYQELVDPKDRHDLGEYYTPEWLCTRVVEEMLPKTGFCAVLDPTCGSGSFLRAAIAHFLEHNKGRTSAELLESIVDNVAGIDIHPLAVTIARATYVLALRDHIDTATRPIQIPVYLADSLFLPSEVKTMNKEEFEIQYGLKPRKSFALPMALLEEPAWFDSLIDVGHRLAVEHARSGDETAQSLAKAIRREVPALAGIAGFEALVEDAWEYVEGMAELIRERRNSIWAFIIRNSYRPALMRERFDVILGNPPWLSYRYIADPEYQAEVKRLAVREYKIAPKSQKLFTQMELATVFLAHALKTFGASGSKAEGRAAARLAFVMPRSVLSADQHATFRLHTHTAPVMVTSYWDLFDVRPVFNVPACVIFAEKSDKGRTRFTKPGYTFLAVEWSGRLPERYLSWQDASTRLKKERVNARVVRLGTRCALSSSKQESQVEEVSFYKELFKDGATIYPRNFYFVHVDWPGREFDTDRLYRAETDPEQKRTAKPPYKDVYLSGQVEGRFLFKTAIAKHVLPFLVLEPADVVLPADIVDNRARIQTARQLKDEGFRNVGDWLTRVETEWARLRGPKLEKTSCYDWLDYSGKLMSQPLDRRYLVLYNAAGTNISAAVFDRETCSRPFFVDHTLYYFATTKKREADYLAAILNASCIDDLIKPFQSRGLMGQRHVHKKVLELPIPKFDLASPTLASLSSLGSAARHQARNWHRAGTENLPNSLARQRAMVRGLLGETLDQIDELVLKLLKGGVEG